LIKNGMADRPLDQLELLKSKDSNAFTQVVRAHQQAIYRLAYRLTGNVEDAMDLTQEVFLRAYRSLPGFRGESDIKTWLYRIAINTGSSWRKREKAIVQMDEALDVPAPGEDNELRMAVREAVESLPFKQRSVFVMHHYEGFKHEEIAGITGRSTGSVKANYFQAVAKLKRKLEGFL
jgi:RNA polymerase sigma-70 factor (ECF subfamily)